LPGPEADLALLIDAARTAGEIARAHFRRRSRDLDEVRRQPGDRGRYRHRPRSAHRSALNARPDYGWLSEETEDDAERLSAQRSFVVDPIDGTRAFIEGQTSFAHSLAVVDGGDVDGGRGLPADEGQALRRGERPWRHAERRAIRVSETNRHGGGQALVTRPNVQPKHWKGGVPPFAALLPPVHRLPAGPCGRGAVRPTMLTFRDTWEWDIAAGAILIAEAGGTVSDASGARIASTQGARWRAGSWRRRANCTGR
jgi:myo-inositol-1(or 4)-monophosphatase